MLVGWQGAVYLVGGGPTMSCNYICPKCGQILIKKIERDEAPDGTMMGVADWRCNRCHIWFDEDEVKGLKTDE